MRKSADLAELGTRAGVLASEARLQIIEALRGQCLCVNALVARLGLTQSAVSQHLRILKQAGLVTSEKRGYWVHYRLNEQRLRQWRDEITRFLDV